MFQKCLSWLILKNYCSQLCSHCRPYFVLMCWIKIMVSLQLYKDKMKNKIINVIYIDFYNFNYCYFLYKNSKVSLSCYQITYDFQKSHLTLSKKKVISKFTLSCKTHVYEILRTLKGALAYFEFVHLLNDQKSVKIKNLK